MRGPIDVLAIAEGSINSFPATGIWPTQKQTRELGSGCTRHARKACCLFLDLRCAMSVSTYGRQGRGFDRSAGLKPSGSYSYRNRGGSGGDFFHVFSVDRKCHAGLLCWSDICVVDSGTLSKRQCIAMGYAFEGRRRGRESRFVCWTLASHPDSVTATRRSHAMAWALSSRSFTERSGECIRRTRACHVKADRWQTV